MINKQTSLKRLRLVCFEAILLLGTHQYFLCKIFFNGTSLAYNTR